MQKSIRLIGVVLCVVVMASAFFGCGANLSEADVQTVLETALQNSLSADLFYWKETDNRDDVSRYSQANVLSDIDSKTYTPLVDENGNYTTLRIQVLQQENGNTVYQSVCGESSGVEEGDEVRSYLFETTADSTGETVQTKTPMTAAEYYESAQFQPYGLQSKLQVLAGLTADDMDFSGDGCEISKRGNVVQLQFLVRDSFLERYEAQYGEPSLFEGAKRVLIEIAYEKISQIVVYVDETIAGSSMHVETEAYNFQLVYLGPKFDVPHYNETNSAGEAVWKDKPSAA